MTLTRRRFLRRAAPLGLLPLIPSCGEAAPRDGSGEPSAESPFQHGVASGDPSAEGVILWTRVTPPAASVSEVEVDFRVATDPALANVVLGGTARAEASSDYTVKVDAGGLGAGTTYYYDFGALGRRSPVGRTKTLAAGALERARLAVVSCANYPGGFFNAYRLVAERSDIDLVLHLGDYLYEFDNGMFGDGTALGRLPEPAREAVSLADYRLRHAQYKRDPDLQEVHRQHPFVVIWDDHEVANDAYRDGAGNHQPDSEGTWQMRKQAALQAYFEWMPIRPPPSDAPRRGYRTSALGDLADLIVLDTRLGRDPRVEGNCDLAAIIDPARSLLGAEQERWFLDQLRASHERGTRWRLVAQQVMFSQRADRSEGCVSHTDQWDGYAESRARVLAWLGEQAIDNVVILTGDAHSSWAFEVADDPFDAALYDAATGAGSRAVEFVVPGVTSAGTGGDPEEQRRNLPHLKFVDLARQGYVLLDLDHQRAQAEWYFVTSVLERGTGEELGAVFEAEAGTNHLQALSAAAPAGEPAPAPAPRDPLPLETEHGEYTRR